MEKIFILEIIVALSILALVYKKLRVVSNNANELNADLIILEKTLDDKKNLLTSLERKFDSTKKDLISKEELILHKDKALNDLEKKIKELNIDLIYTYNKFKLFDKQEGFKEYKQLQQAKRDLEEYVTGVQTMLKNNKGRFTPSTSAATIKMLLDKLRRCCKVDMSDDVDDMLRRHIMEISKSDDDSKLKKKKNKGRDIE